MNRPQECALERLSLANKGESLCVREGYADKHVEATLRSGRSWKINEDGVASKQAPDFSVRGWL